LKEATEEQKRLDEKTRSRLQRRIETLQESLSEAQEQAATDPLTGIANRGRFDESIAAGSNRPRSRRAVRARSPDIDASRRSTTRTATRWAIA
jgi:PleD family two-component response regulator